jgi:hypothetical protein
MTIQPKRRKNAMATMQPGEPRMHLHASGRRAEVCA